MIFFLLGRAHSARPPGASAATGPGICFSFCIDWSKVVLISQFFAFFVHTHTYTTTPIHKNTKGDD
jgi:hypothetical protein